MTPALLVSDVHLSPSCGLQASAALSRLIAAHPGVDVHLVGDIFDLSQTPAGQRPAETLGRTIAAHPEWLSQSRKHLKSGGRLCLVPGNHDADLSDAETAAVLYAALEPPDDRQLSVAPWFHRHGSVHIEHGHVYDPDCAPNHPLSPANVRSEGLGTALVRRFLAPSESLEFAHAHELTPRSGLWLALKKWGLRTPVHVLWYFWTAAGLCVESLNAEPVRDAAWTAGTAAMPAHAARTGLSLDVLQALIATVPRPTHHGFKDTFLRLYFDRVLAGASAGLGTSLLVASASAPALLAPAAAMALPGFGYLYASGARSKRHESGPVAALENAAVRIRELTACSLVVFGHSHVAAEQPGYVNLGSFSFGRGQRPYLVLDEAGRGEIQRLPC